MQGNPALQGAGSAQPRPSQPQVPFSQKTSKDLSQFEERLLYDKRGLDPSGHSFSQQQ